MTPIVVFPGFKTVMYLRTRIHYEFNSNMITTDFLRFYEAISYI